MSTKFPKAVLAALLISSLLRTTIQVAEPGIVGQVVESRGASLGGVLIPGASTILAGEVLVTDHSGRALVSFSSGDRLNLASDTSVSFERRRGAVVARMSRGDLLAEVHNPGAMVIEPSEYRIAPDSTAPAACFVTILADRRTVILARHGRVSVTDLHSGAVRDLAPGDEIAMAAPAAPGQEPEPSQPAPPKPAGPAPAGGTGQPTTPTGNTVPAAAHKSNTALILIVVGAAAVAGVAVAAAAGGGHGGGGGPVSPSAP